MYPSYEMGTDILDWEHAATDYRDTFREEAHNLGYGRCNILKTYCCLTFLAFIDALFLYIINLLVC